MERAPTPAQTVGAQAEGCHPALYPASCCEAVSLRCSPARRDPHPGGRAVDTQCASTQPGGKRPGGRGEQGLRQPRCRIAAPSGLLMGLAEPPCLRPSPADLPRGDSLGARWRSPPSLAQPPWGAEAPPAMEPCGTGPDIEPEPTGERCWVGGRPWGFSVLGFGGSQS